MAHQYPTYQEPPQPVFRAGELLSYQDRFMTSVQPYVSYITNVDVEVARSYIICGFWTGVSLVGVMICTSIVLGTFCRIARTREFPNIEAIHQIAAINDQTFMWIMAVYLASVCSFFYHYRGMAIEDCWWACMQILCAAEGVVLLSMVAIWVTFRACRWGLRRVFGVDEPTRHYHWQ